MTSKYRKVLALGAVLACLALIIGYVSSRPKAPEDAIEEHIQALLTEDWDAIIGLAPPDEVSKNALNANRLRLLFETAGEGLDLKDSLANCTVTEPIEQVDGRAIFALEPPGFDGRKLLMEAAMDANGNWKVPIYQTLYQVCRVSAASLPGSLDRLADSMQAIDLPTFYIWQRNAFVTVPDLRRAARGELDVAQLEKPANCRRGSLLRCRTRLLSPSAVKVVGWRHPARRARCPD